jgi:hypothetical protein
MKGIAALREEQESDVGAERASENGNAADVGCGRVDVSGNGPNANCDGGDVNGSVIDVSGSAADVSGNGPDLYACDGKHLGTEVAAQHAMTIAAQPATTNRATVATITATGIVTNMCRPTYERSLFMAASSSQSNRICSKQKGAEGTDPPHPLLTDPVSL